MPTTVSTGTLLQVVSIIFMIGAIWGAILLLKDAMKHKGFAKAIRMISGIVQFLAILCSTIIIATIMSNPTAASTSLGTILTISFGIGILSIITNIRGAILLFKESGKNIGFKKGIRIICGIIMILSLFLSFLTV